MKIRFFFAFWFIVLLPSPMAAQSASFKTVYGTVSDLKTGEPLPHAIVGIARNKIGTVANASGKFILKISAKYGTDTIIVSYLGYQTITKPILSLQDSVISLQLEIKPRKIAPIVVRPRNNTDLIDEIFQKYTDNYITKPVGMKGFYREVIREDGLFIEFIEAVLGIYKQSVSKNASDRITILKGRRKADVKSSNLWHYIKFIDGPYEAIKCDVAKYQKKFITVAQSPLNFLRKKYYKFYDYTIDDTYPDFLVIEFRPKEASKRAVLEGFIYVERESRAIVRLEYRFHKSNIKRASLVSGITESDLYKLGVTISPKDYFSEVNYRQFNGIWYLSYVRMSYSFLFQSPAGKHIIDNTVELLITEIDNDKPIKYPNNKLIKYHESIVPQLGKFDESFWENFNTLAPLSNQ